MAACRHNVGQLQNDRHSNRVLNRATGSSSPTGPPFTGLNYPTGVAVGNTGTFYVTDQGTNSRMLELAADLSVIGRKVCEPVTPPSRYLSADECYYVVGTLASICCAMLTAVPAASESAHPITSMARYWSRSATADSSRCDQCCPRRNVSRLWWRSGCHWCSRPALGICPNTALYPLPE